MPTQLGWFIFLAPVGTRREGHTFAVPETEALGKVTLFFFSSSLIMVAVCLMAFLRGGGLSTSENLWRGAPPKVEETQPLCLYAPITESCAAPADH